MRNRSSSPGFGFLIGTQSSPIFPEPSAENAASHATLHAVRVIGALAGLVLIAGCSSGSGAGNPGVGNTGGGQNASAICSKIIALPCSEYQTVAQCEAAVADGRQDAQEAGCSAEYEKLLSCTGAHLPSCVDGELTTHPQCVDDAFAYAGCDGTVICTGGSTSTGCTYSCGDLAMECQGSGGSWNCTCTEGPKAGQSFTLNDYPDACDRTPLESNCE
jgi:hypothetical protein